MCSYRGDLSRLQRREGERDRGKTERRNQGSKEQKKNNKNRRRRRNSCGQRRDGGGFYNLAVLFKFFPRSVTTSGRDAKKEPQNLGVDKRSPQFHLACPHCVHNDIFFLFFQVIDRHLAAALCNTEAAEVKTVRFKHVYRYVCGRVCVCFPVGPHEAVVKIVHPDTL